MLEALRLSGSEEQKRHYFARVLDGDRLGNAFTEIGTKTPVTDDRPISVTAAGLTVHAAPPKRRTNAAAEDGNLAAEFADDLGIAHREGGRPDGHLHVLGTLHPAIQEGAGTGRGT